MSRRTLDLDLGNTRIKWRYSNGTARQEGALLNADFDRDGLPEIPVERIRIAAVAEEQVVNSVMNACRKRWNIEPELAVVEEQCAGVRQGYRDRSRLGVDRWLAILGAFAHVQGSCVVVSCGTALTVDAVTGGGEHLGGYIVPGLEMMRRALFSGTRAVKLDQIDAEVELRPGRDTQEAVSRGMLLMVQGLVGSVLDLLRSRGEQPALILSGGDGARLLPLWSATSTNVQYLPNLVLDGLALALP